MKINNNPCTWYSATNLWKSSWGKPCESEVTLLMRWYK